MEKVRGLQNLAFQLGLDEGKFLYFIIPKIKEKWSECYFPLLFCFVHIHEPAFLVTL